MANNKKKASGKKPDGANVSLPEEKGAQAKKAKTAAAEKKPNIFVRMGRAIKRFVKGFFSEGKKIIWADGKTVLKNTGVVLAVIVFIGIFVWLFDFGIEKLLVYSVSASPKLQTEQSVDEGATEEQTQAETEAETQGDTQESEGDTAAAEGSTAAAGAMNLLDGFVID